MAVSAIQVSRCRAEGFASEDAEGAAIDPPAAITAETQTPIARTAKANDQMAVWVCSEKNGSIRNG